MNGGKQRSLRIVDQEKGGKIINFDLPDESQTVRQFIAAYHWQHGEKSRGLNTGFLGLYRERKEEGREGEWELLSDSAALASFDIADDELLMLKLRPQTIYVTMTKPFIIDFSEPLDAVLPTILAGFGETLTADFLSRYCLQKEAAVTDKDELLDLNKTLSDNNVARNAALLLKKTAYRVTSSDEIMTVGGGSGQLPLSRSGNIQRKISISPEFDEDSDSNDDDGEERAPVIQYWKGAHRLAGCLRRNMSGEGLRVTQNPLRGGPGSLASTRHMLSPREVAATTNPGVLNTSSDGLTIRKWRQRMRSLNRSDSKEDTTPNSDTTAKRDRVYGVPLAELLRRESPEREAGAGAKPDGGEVAAGPVGEEAEGVIPKMVTSMLQFLETEEALKAEGIFRLSSNFEEMMRIKEQIDRGQEVNFSECGAHMVINLLKKFLHELPDALLSSVLYQRYISAVQGDDAARLAYLVALLNSLAPSSRSLLRRLLIYLRNVVAHSGENRMDLHNLATTLAPVLMREKPAFQQTAFASGSVVLPPRHQRHHQRRASDSAVVHAMVQEAVRAAKVLEILISTPDEELFFAKTSEEGNHHHLSVARATSDIKSSPLSTSPATEAEHLVLQAGDIVFVFQKRDDVWWVEHKNTRKLVQVPAEVAESALATVAERVELAHQPGLESGECRAIERVLSHDDVSDDDDDSGGGGDEESPRRTDGSSLLSFLDRDPAKKEKRSASQRHAKLVSPFVKPAPPSGSLGTSSSYTIDSSSANRPSPREKRKSIGIVGNALLGPRKDREKGTSSSSGSPREKDAKKEKKEHKKEHKKDKQHKREKKEKDKEQHVV
ncbi:RhoGAP domain containing protein, partial [Acanthamoeba castellanii str. Neff]